jgi:hypothetical protein
MRCHSFAACLALAVLALLGPAASADSGEKQRFRGRLEGNVTLTPLNPPLAIVAVDGTGKANKLGRFTFTHSHVVNLATLSAAGSYEFIAANGDKLFADTTAEGSLTEIPGVLSIVESATITGGTGRFAGATGGFVVERLLDTVALTTVGSFKGTIRTRSRGHHHVDDDDDRNND